MSDSTDRSGTTRHLPRDLFPAIEPRHEGRLDVGDGHELAWEEVGAADGLPVVFVHGGPGAGAQPISRRFFDPGRFRVVLFDQRGAGRSTPKAEIAANTTQNLVADMERLREHLGIDRWIVFGGSWGSTLALAYGQTHPDRCLGFVLRGIFLFRAAEVDWFLNGMGRFFPEAAAAFRHALPAAERDDPLAAYHRRLCDPDPAVHRPAAEAWCRYEEACSRLVPRGAAGGGSLAMARIEAHYMVNAGFLEEGALLAGMERLAEHPAILVQGRYDMVCPPWTAHDLAEAWPGAELVMVPEAGHSALETETRRALVAALGRLADRLEGRAGGGR